MAYKGHTINPKTFDKGQIKILLMILPMVLLTGLPIVFIFFHAFKPMEELFAFPPKFITTNPTFDNFRQLFKASRSAGIPLSKYVFNSLLITGAVVFSSLILTTAAAYSLSKLKYKGRNMLFTINQVAIMFVPVAVMIPRYLVVNVLGMTNSYWAQILPLIPLPVALFLVKQFVDQVPDSLIEAAYMDGAKELQIYTKVIIPLIKPAAVTAFILMFQNLWTNTGSSYIYKENLKNVGYMISQIASGSNVGVARAGVLAAASVIMFSIPCAVFLMMQTNVISTMATSGMKE